MEHEERLRIISEAKRLAREKRRVKFIGYMRKTGIRVRYVRCSHGDKGTG